MDNYKGVEYLRNLLAVKRPKVLKRYKYYNMKAKARDLNTSTPPSMRWLNSTLGWCGSAVDALADRVVFREFADDNFNINEIFHLNNPDIFFDSAVLSALISSCCFVYISWDSNNYPRLQVVDGGNATGTIDPITGLLKEGYVVLERDTNDDVLVDAYLIPNQTFIFQKGQKKPVVINHNVNHPLLVPIINRPDAEKPFGHSRITEACMKLVDSAERTIKRAEIAAEYYSYPQKYAIGVSEDLEMDKWKASMSSMLMFTKDEDGDKPVLGQFTTQSMTPHMDMIKTLASLFAGETDLTLDDLGFVTSNPTSAESIKASHEKLRLKARKAQRTLGSGFLNVGYLAACLRDGINYERSAFYGTTLKWHPIFEPDASMLSSIGDGVIKINQAMPGYINEQNMLDLTGIDGESGGSEWI